MEPIEWRVQPILARPGRVAGALAGALAVGAAVASFDGQPWTGAFATLFMLVMLNRAILPSAYRVDSGGVLLDHPLRRRIVPWESMRLLAVDPDGALVRWGSSRSAQASIWFPPDPARVKAIVDAMHAFAAPTRRCIIVDRRSAGGTATAAARKETP